MSTQQQEFICELAMPDLSRYRQAIPAVLPSLPLNQKHQLPPVPAVYFALGEDNEVLYIGRSVSLSARWSAHHRFSELQDLGNVRLAWIEFETEEFLEEVEQVLIDHFSPKLNGLPTKTNPEDRIGIGVYIRLNPAEKEAVHIAAKREERSLADWVRRSARKKLRELGLLPDIEDELKAELKKKR